MRTSAPSGVKTLQHEKTAGLVRSQARAAHFPIFYERRKTVNQYGPEEGSSLPVTFSVSSSTSSGIIATGRIVRESAEAAVVDSRIADREAWRLFWLPYSRPSGSSDFANPLPVDSDLIPDAPSSLQTLRAGLTIWLPTVNGAPVCEIGPFSDLASFDGQPVEAFYIVEAPFSNMGEMYENEALVVREEGSARRTLEVS